MKTYNFKFHLLFYIFLITGLSEAAAQDENSSLGVNLGGLDAWSSEWVFVNIAHQSYGWMPIDRQPAWKGFISEDKLTKDKYLKPGESGMLCVVWDAPVPVTGSFILSYSGNYSASLSKYNQNVTETSNRPGKLEFTANGTKYIYIDFRANDTSSRVSEIKLIKEEDKNSTNIFSQSFLDDIKRFKVLRFMDFMQTNNSDVVGISDYTTNNSLIQRPMSIKMIVELANKLNADPWICIPVDADDDLVASWASYIANNLESSLTVKVELSNEVWNSIFDQYGKAALKARIVGISNTGKDWEDAPAYYGYRSAQIHKIFGAEFGKVTDAPGFCKIVAWQAANSWSFTDKVLPEYKQGSNNVLPDEVAIAPYFGGYLDNKPSVSNWTEEMLFEELFNGTYIGTSPGSAIDEAVGWTRKYIKICNDNGISDLICYEAGQHLVGVNGNENNEKLTGLFIAANRSVKMKDAYTEYLRRLQAAGCGTICLYTSHGRPSKWGSWGIKEYIGQDTAETPKYQSAIEFITKNSVVTTGEKTKSQLLK